MGQSTWSHAPPSGKAAESVFTDLMTCLPPAEGIRHTLSPFHTTRKSAPFRVEHVVSYPDHYSPAFACSAILCPLPIHTPCGVLTRPAHPGGKTTGLPSSTAMTRWGGCCLSTDGLVSVCRDGNTGHPTACRFGPGVCSYFRLLCFTVVTTVHLDSPDHRAWPLVRHVASRLRSRSSRSDSAACAGVRCPGERLIAGRNPVLGRLRGHKRQA